MNIMYLDTNPRMCAQFHNNKHVVKMIVEYAQILSTTHRTCDGVEYIDTSSGRKIKRWKLSSIKEEHLYKATHINHPSVKWTRESQQNYYWLYTLFLELLAEYQYRYNKVHACTKLIPHLGIAPINIPWKPFTPPPLAMDSQYRLSNPIESYRNYYKLGKQHLATWTPRNPPIWL